MDAPSGNVARGAGLLFLPRVHQNDLHLAGVLLLARAVSAGAAIRHAVPFPGAGGLWMASRDMQATFTRVLHLGLSVFGYLRAFGELHFSSFLLAGNLSMASPVAVEQLLEIVPLPFLQRLVCFLIFSGSPWRR